MVLEPFQRPSHFRRQRVQVTAHQADASDGVQGHFGETPKNLSVCKQQPRPQGLGDLRLQVVIIQNVC